MYFVWRLHDCLCSIASTGHWKHWAYRNNSIVKQPWKRHWRIRAPNGIEASWENWGRYLRETSGCIALSARVYRLRLFVVSVLLRSGDVNLPTTNTDDYLPRQNDEVGHCIGHDGVCSVRFTFICLVGVPFCFCCYFNFCFCFVPVPISDSVSVSISFLCLFLFLFQFQFLFR